MMDIDFSKHHFCTYFDHNFLGQGIALAQSLIAHCPGATIHVLCLSEHCEEALRKLNLNAIEIISMSSFLEAFPELRHVQGSRPQVEFYFSCTPFLPRFVFETTSHCSFVTYLDADLFFFSSPRELLAEVERYSISITKHNFALHEDRFNRLFGRFNVAWISFSKSDSAMNCLRRWSDQCLESCGQDGGEVYGDQLYLDEWPTQYGAHVIESVGVNVAPWNSAQYTIGSSKGQVTVDGESLVFFHFSGLRKRDFGLVDTGYERFGTPPTAMVRRAVFGRYLEHLDRVEELLTIRNLTVPVLIHSVRTSEERPYRYPFHKSLRRTRELYLDVVRALKGYYLLRVFDKVIW